MKILDQNTGGRGEVEHPLYGGNFTRTGGPPLPFVLPGELITAADSAALQILSPSPDRVAPGCIHFGTCGGCHYQHAAYPTQLELKRTILTDLLAPARIEVPIKVKSGPAWNYRNRIRLRIEPANADAAQPFAAGYSLRTTNDFLPITMCPIAAPLLWRAARTLMQLAAADALVARWLAATAELELFCTPDEFALQLQFFLRSADAGRREASSFAGLCQRLEAAIPELAGAGATLDPDLNRRARRLWDGVAWGAAGLNYPAAGRTYWLPRGAFFQVNRFLVDSLAGLVTGSQSGALAWDLYAGVGLFTRILAERFTRVLAVEGGEAAISSLQSAARAQPSITPVHSPTLDFLRARVLDRERPGLIVLDPPRAGLGSEGAALLTRLRAPRLVYVSCDPTTLARDLAVLDAAYRVETLHLVDLFPQTFHLETVVHLTLR